MRLSLGPFSLWIFPHLKHQDYAKGLPSFKVEISSDTGNLLVLFN